MSSQTAAIEQNPLVKFGNIAVMVVAGAWTLFHLIWGFAGQTSDDYWGIALLILFVLALILSFVQYAAERSTLLATAPAERFPEPSISRFFLASAGSSPLWFVVRMNVGAAWFLAGWEKVIDPAWGTSGKALLGFVTGAVAKSTGAHPAVQGWYAGFLENIVHNSAGFFSILVAYGEVAVGLGILLGILTGIAAGFGVLMNLNYLLAGTVSTNPILGVFGLFLIFSWRVCGWIGGDRWFLPAIGLPWKAGTWFRRETTPPAPSAAS